nr:hypothetical protein [uncultured Bacteroides sp.]
MNQAGNGQVCMLQKIVHDNLDIDIDIEEDTGLSNDFIIKVASMELDKERSLIALINKYKQAGKSFTLNNAAVVFTQTWTNFVCEIAELTSIWGDYVCELTAQVINTITVLARYSPIDGQGAITVTAELSPVAVYLNVFLRDEDTSAERIVTVLHERINTDSAPEAVSYEFDQGINERVIKVELTQEYDEVYHYYLELTII